MSEIFSTGNSIIYKINNLGSIKYLGKSWFYSFQCKDLFSKNQGVMTVAQILNIRKLSTEIQHQVPLPVVDEHFMSVGPVYAIKLIKAH